MQISNTRITAGVRFTVAPGGGGGITSPLTFTSSSLGNWNWGAGPVTSSTGVFMIGGSDSSSTNGVFLNSDGGQIGWGGAPTTVRGLRFVAVANGSNQTVRSTNYAPGTWSTDSITTGNWTGVTSGLGLAVAVQSGSASGAYSTNGGDTWTTSTMPASAEWTGVAFGLGTGGFQGTPVFVAVAANSDQAAYSMDGITWQNSTLPFSGNWRGIAYAGTDFNTGSARNSFFAVASGSDVAAWTTDGGVTWSNTASLGSAEAWSVIGGLGVNGGSPGIVIMAPGNSTAKGTLVENPPVWNSIDLGTALDWSAVAGVGPQVQDFVAIASGSDATVTGSAGASSWTYGANLPSAAQWSSMVSTQIYYGNVLAVASGGTTAAIGVGSGSGLTWSSTSLPVSADWSSVTAGAGVGALQQLFAGNVSGNPAYAAEWSPVGSYTQIIYTTDFGSNWNIAAPLANAATVAMQGYFNNQWIAIANLPAASDFYYFTSSDLVTWSNSGGQVPGAGGASSLPYISTYAEGRYIAVDGGQTGNIWNSTNLTSWANTQIADPSVQPTTLLPVTYGNGRFVTTTSQSYYTANFESAPASVVYSDDGVTWTAIAAPGAAAGDNSGVVIGYANSNFFLGTISYSSFPPSSNMYFSADAITWNQASANLAGGLQSPQGGTPPAVWNSTQVVLLTSAGGTGGSTINYSI